MHLRRVSISILIVANGNIRVDLNGIALAWRGMAWCDEVIGENKVNTLNNNVNDDDDNNMVMNFQW